MASGSGSTRTSSNSSTVHRLRFNRMSVPRMPKKYRALYEEMAPLIQEFRELEKQGELYKKEVALRRAMTTKQNDKHIIAERKAK